MNAKEKDRRRTLALMGAGAAGCLAPGALRGAEPPGADRLSVAEYRSADAASVGFTTRGLDNVRSEFAAMLAEGLHPAAGLAVMRSGKLVIELAGGTLDDGKPARFDTLYQIRSTTKALATMVMLQAFERRRFDFDDPIARHWPEFAQNGKGEITIRQLMSHRAGIPDGPAIAYADMGSREKIAAAVAAMTPVWPPGAQSGYHAATIGWVTDELLQRWEGANTATLFARDIARPVAVNDVQIGLPADKFYRMAKMVVEEEVREGQSSRAAFSDFLNTPEGIGLPLSWVGGVASPRDLVRVFSILAHEGSFKGHDYFTAKTQAFASEPTNAAGTVDQRLGTAEHWGTGFMLGDTPNAYGTTARPRAIGHSGGGAAVAWGDPAERLAVAFLTNRMVRSGSAQRNARMADAIYAAMG
ncbi:MAG: beta-lactamase family protein [Alphaproteobacteria bacterium]|nr:beta-lactamase family protein [Alphaproteobacteria bacterium]